MQRRQQKSRSTKRQRTADRTGPSGSTPPDADNSDRDSEHASRAADDSESDSDDDQVCY